MKLADRLTQAGKIYVCDMLDRLQSSTLIPIFFRPLVLRIMGIATGRRCYIGPSVRFHRANIRFGNRCIVGKGTIFDASGEIEIGDRVSMAAGCIVHSATHVIQQSVCRMDLVQVDLLRTVIGRGCWLGTGSIILPGVTVGEGCVIAAGAVVRSSCLPNGLYAGVPAKRIRDLPVSLDTPVHAGRPVVE